VLEVEESVWSPMYGLKGLNNFFISLSFYNTSVGKIDATLEVKTTNAAWNANKPLTNTKNSFATNSCNFPKLTVPLEVKTGSDFDKRAHTAQVCICFVFPTR
jgi:hypothetical protein